jgi:hypothetical protein
MNPCHKLSGILAGCSARLAVQPAILNGGRLVKHARYYWLLLAEGHLTRKLFASMLRMMAALPLPDG